MTHSCAIESCARPSRKRGWCTLHYGRFLRHGDPLVARRYDQHGARTGQVSGEYRSWQAMRNRCLNPASADYAYYGGRGIAVCAPWHSFPRFLADMGPRPSPTHTIERKNNDGNYEPQNCVWATRAQQLLNRRPNGSGAAKWMPSQLVDVDGVQDTPAGWDRRKGLRTGTVLARIRSGWDPLRAATTTRCTKGRPASKRSAA